MVKKLNLANKKVKSASMEKDMKTKGFTLIELLVVISIIALLLAILMPALGKVKEKAKAVVCLTRMKQWNLVAMTYGMDNNSKFADPSGGAHGHWWLKPLRPYYSDPKIRLCPSAQRPPEEALWGSRKPNESWASPNLFPELEKGEVIDGVEVIYGSISPNGWLMDISETGDVYGAKKGKSWRNFDEVKPDVPLFLDCYWVDGWPLDTDVPQDNPNDSDTWDIHANYMQEFNIDRHSGGVSVVYMDGSCRKVGLKGLWELKWHKEFDIHNAQTQPDAVWPDWMVKFGNKR